MKSTLTRLIAAGAMALALTGCSTLGNITGLSETAVQVADLITDDSTSTKGATAGMSSSDARDVLINQAYYGAVKAVHGAGKEGAGPQLLLDIEPLDGQPIVIHAKRFKVYAPPQGAGAAERLPIAAPVEKIPTWKAVSQEARGWFRDAVVPWKSIDESTETERLRYTTDAATTRYLARQNNQLMRDLVGTKNDPAELDRAEADKVRAEADRIRAQNTTTTATP